MNIKRIGIIALFITMLIPVSNVFASEGLLNNVPTDEGSYLLTDNDLSTGENLAVGESINFTFSTLVDINRYDSNSLSSFPSLIFYDSNGQVILSTTFYNQGSSLENVVDVKKIEIVNNSDVNVDLNEFNVYYDDVDSDGDGISDSEDIYPNDPTNTPPEPEDTTAPTNVLNVTHSVTDSAVTFDYDLPLDEDFSHLQIYRDMELLVSNHSLTTFTDNGLAAETNYTYTFKSVDVNGNVSTGNSVGITTSALNDTVAPETPTGVDISLASSALSVSWYQNVESDLAGYNIYLDGVKYNSSIIIDNYFEVMNLNNGMEYSIQVTAVDTSGNESPLSVMDYATPSIESMPIFDMNYELTDVAESTSNWFSSLWLILAFAVAIPLSFYIANRVKALFLT